MKAREIIAILQREHSLEQDWLFFYELRIGTGFGKDADQRIDAWAMHAVPSKRFRRIAYEIKVSRADFLRERKQPLKSRRARLLSNEFYFIAPPDEIPVEAGLIEVSLQERINLGARNVPLGDGRFWVLETVVPAPWCDRPGPSLQFLAAVVRRALKDGTGLLDLPQRPPATPAPAPIEGSRSIRHWFARQHGREGVDDAQWFTNGGWHCAAVRASEPRSGG